MPLIVIPDDEPAVVSVSAAYARLNGMDVRTYASRPSNQHELIERIRDANHKGLCFEHAASIRVSLGCWIEIRRPIEFAAEW